MLNIHSQVPWRPRAGARTTGAKLALKPVHVWGIRIRQISGPASCCWATRSWKAPSDTSGLRSMMRWSCQRLWSCSQAKGALRTMSGLPDRSLYVLQG